MVTLKLNNQNYNMPNSWYDISITDYKFINDVTSNELLTEGDKLITILSYLTSIPIETLNNIEYANIKEVIEELSFLKNSSFPESISTIFKVGDNTYKLKEFKKHTLGEVVSIETLIKQSEGDILSIIGKLIYILYSKNGEEFDADLIDEEAKIIEDNVSIAELNSIIVFFLSIGLTYQQSIHKSLKKQRWMKMGIKEKLIMVLNLMKTGSGLAWSKGWQKGISLSSKKSLNKII